MLAQCIGEILVLVGGSLVAVCAIVGLAFIVSELDKEDK